MVDLFICSSLHVVLVPVVPKPIPWWIHGWRSHTTNTTRWKPQKTHSLQSLISWFSSDVVHIPVDQFNLSSSSTPLKQCHRHNSVDHQWKDTGTFGLFSLWSILCPHSVWTSSELPSALSPQTFIPVTEQMFLWSGWIETLCVSTCLDLDWIGLFLLGPPAQPLHMEMNISSPVTFMFLCLVPDK